MAVSLVAAGDKRVRPVSPGRIILEVIRVNLLECPGSAGDAGEELLISLSVHAGRDARYSGSAVIEEAVFAMRTHHGCRYHEIDAVIENRAPARTSFASRLRILVSRGQFAAIDTGATAGDHVDDAQHRILAVNRPARTWNEFNSLDHVHV